MSGDKTFTGSCHCGHFNYTINLPAEKLANPTAIRCNCTFCQKRGFANLEVAPASFKLLSPASKSELGDYVVKTSEDCHRYFCQTCGCQAFQEGKYEHDGKTHHFFGVNLGTIDQPQEGLDLSDVKFKYLDMKNLSAFEARDTPYPGGIH